MTEKVVLTPTENETEVMYPIAETFHSVQGEGFWVGTPMFFIRLAGCNVGRYMTTLADLPKPEEKHDTITILRHSICTTFDGQKFLCDTDYHASSKFSIRDLVSEVDMEKHVCVTGGEPFMHDLEPLFSRLSDRTGVDMIHIETSGTLPCPNYPKVPCERIWVTCCPKMVDDKKLVIDPAYVDEWKLLVGPGFEEATLRKFDEFILSTCEHRYLQPINGISKVWKANLDRCLELLSKFPEWKLSSQLHKFIGVR